MRDATDGGASGNTVFVMLPVTGGIVTIEEHLIGTAKIDADVTLDTYLDDGGPTTGVQGVVAIEGDVIIDTGIVLTLVGNVELRLFGQPGQLELHDTAVIDGDGFVAFSFIGGEYAILLGESTIDCLMATPPNTAFINNMRVEVLSGELSVVDECLNDDESDLLITNRLQVDVGTLDMKDNNLHIASLSEASGGDNPGVEIVGGATVRGSGTFIIEVEEPAEVPEGLAKTAGPVGFANTSDDCFVIEGAGELMMSFDKITDAGVCIDLEEIGAGGKSFNQAGAIFVRNAVTVNGTFANHSLVGDVPEKGARTEFWKLETITVNLEVEGPGEEVDPTGSGFTNGTCETGALAVGNESGVYFSRL